MMEPAEIERILKTKLAGSEVWVEDLTGSKDHFQVIIVAGEFEGLGMVAQHQKVYGALKEELKGAIHALTLKTFTPSEWQKEKSQYQTPRGIS